MPILKNHWYKISINQLNPHKSAIKIIFIVGIIFLALPVFVLADSLGETHDFFVDSSYDLTGRDEISATLREISPQLYFYLDDDWWKILDYPQKQEIEQALHFLGYEFYYTIYLTLTSVFGSEWKPGIDGDEHITVLVHPMEEEAGGYFNPGDEYPRAHFSNSNQREMVYLNANYITEPLAKSYLAHEFAHLITFNQKNRKYGIEEEIWLDEARAEYVPTLIGYDDVYEGSNLQRRVDTFLIEPTNSLTEWENKKADYGALNLFIQYLVDHYGVKILADSLHSDKVGILSLDEALKANGFKEDFSQIFTNWTIAVLINDCGFDEKYCYLNQNLKDLRIVPQINFLPFVGESTLSLTNETQNWAGNWYKIIGGWGTLKVKFIGNPENLFKIPYLTQDLAGNWRVNFLELNEYQRGEILIPEFRKKITSVTIIPSIQTKISGFDGPVSTFTFSWSASIIGSQEETELIKELLAQIKELKAEIARVRAQIEAILAEKAKPPTKFWWEGCQKFEENLYYELRNDERVRCLQEFLKSQGPEIYPEGLVTGNFLSLTKAAVIRFQEKYADEVLAPWELTEGTGFVGETTRVKINELLSK